LQEKHSADGGKLASWPNLYTKMKKDFSTQWKGSSQKRKQRKYIANMPLHLRSKLMNSPLSKELRKKYGARSISIRKGDEVRIMRGRFNGKKGKVDKVELKRTRVTIEGINRTKKDGSKVKVWFNPSKVMITEMYDDKKRIKRLSSVKTEGEKRNANSAK